MARAWAIYRRSRRLRAVFSLVLLLTTPTLAIGLDETGARLGRAPAGIIASASEAP